MSANKGKQPWNAGKGKGWQDKNGYRWLYVREDGKRRARREHRVIMEAHIGRRLEPWEVVHHRDHNPANNTIDNLELMEAGAHTVHHHTGTRQSYDACRSMEAFALLREELRHVRAIYADLLVAAIAVIASEDDAPRADFTGYLATNDAALALLRAAIAKVEGRS